MSYTLVVVDMQPDFESSYKVVDNVAFYVKQAVKDGAAIIFLEYRAHGETLHDVAKYTYGYDRVYHASKNRDDGSYRVEELVSAYNLPEKFFVCGVNYSACVKSTVEGMIEDYGWKDISIFEDACNQPESWDSDNPWFRDDYSWASGQQWFVDNGVNILNGEIRD